MTLNKKDRKQIAEVIRRTRNVIQFCESAEWSDPSTKAEIDRLASTLRQVDQTYSKFAEEHGIETTSG